MEEGGGNVERLGGGGGGGELLGLTHLISLGRRGDQHVHHEWVDSVSRASAILHHSQLLKNTHTHTCGK